MASSSLIEEIGSHALSGRSLQGVPLHYKCCAFELTDGRIPNCVSKVRKTVYAPESFRVLSAHMFKVHNIDVAYKCATIMADKKEREEALTVAPKTTKKVTLFAPETAKKKPGEIQVVYKLFDGSFCTKDDYDDAMNNIRIEDGDVDDWEFEQP